MNNQPYGAGEADDAYKALYQQNLLLRRQVEHLSTLREIALSISSTLETAATMRSIATVVQSSLNVNRLLIYEYDREEGVLRPTIAKYGDDLITAERLTEERVPPGRSPLWEVFEHPQVLLENTKQLSTAYVPLRMKDETFGILVLQGPKEEEQFKKEDVPLFQELGSQIAVAINNAHLYAQAVTDGLTKLFVRRYFDLRMNEEFAQAQRYGKVFSVMLFDIDHFKKFNDTHGHQTGDQVLKQFAVLLQKNTRTSDICCRYGGEEMVIILPETNLEEAGMLAEKLCHRVRSHVFTGTEQQPLHVTTSIGVACSHDAFGSAASMVEAADKALYRAKESGRDHSRLYTAAGCIPPK